MKCPMCNGAGEAEYSNGMFAWKSTCMQCRGKGTIEPLTNEEYIRSCSTEELAEFLADKCNEVVEFILNEVDEHEQIEPDDYWYRKSAFVEWLKGEHHD